MYFVHVSDKEVYVYKSVGGQVVAYDAQSNKSTVLLDNSTFVSYTSKYSETCFSGKVLG